MAWDRKITFMPEGVMVKLNKRHVEVFVERKEFGSPDEYPETPKIFRPFHLVINIALFSKQEPSQYLTYFDPPFELWVPYTSEDIENASGKPMKLGWWNNETGEWVPLDFKDVPDKCDRYAGYGVALVSEWTDPPVAWGT